jgi:molecular chaperone DnaJ
MTFHQGIMIMRTECHSCNGTGQTIGQPCTNCSGEGVEVLKTNEELKIPRGIDNGATLRFRGKGHVNGDLIVKIGVRKHPMFRREGNDSHAEKEISVVDAILGTDIQIETIYGESKKVKISPGTQNGDKIKVLKEGFFKLNTNEKGSHVITIKIKIP